ncbi:MAG: sulfotransferase family 2 domain-containing protein [Desulfurivibrionaceae bacterium]
MNEITQNNLIEKKQEYFSRMRTNTLYGYNTLDNLDTRFLFLHIPKTAGTMLNKILRNNFGKNLYHDNLFYADISYEPWHIEEAFKILPHRCFSSHALRGTSLPSNAKDQFVSISIVRDPKQQAISCYFDLRNRVASPHHYTKTMSITELTNAWEKTGFKREFAYAVPQLRWLYPDTNNAMKKVNKDINDLRLLLFPQDRFNDAMICLEKMFSQSFHDCSYGRKANVSTRDYELTEEDKTAVERLPWLSDDDELVAASHEFIDGLTRDLFPSKSSLETAREDFRKRCHKKYEQLNQLSKVSFPSRVRLALRVLAGHK